jgi:hypothetical protein
MTPEVTKTVLNKIILNVWTLDRKWTSIIIWPRDRASISVQQLCIIVSRLFSNPFTILYKTEFQNPQIFQQTIMSSLFPRAFYFSSASLNHTPLKKPFYIDTMWTRVPGGHLTGFSGVVLLHIPDVPNVPHVPPPRCDLGCGSIFSPVR